MVLKEKDNKFKMIILVFLLISFIIYFRNKNCCCRLNSHEKKIFDFFEEVALSSEYFYNPKKVVKWVKPIKLFLYYDEEYSLYQGEIVDAVNQINELLSFSNFQIEWASSIESSNTVIYLCNKDSLNELNTEFYSFIFNESGISYQIAGLTKTYINSRYEIEKALIFIDIDDSQSMIITTIKEEILHSIGFPNDSKSNISILFEGKDEYTFFNDYSEMDKEVIKLLYHSKMKPGYNRNNVCCLIKEYLD